MAESSSSRRFLPARYLLPYEPRRSLAFRTAEVLAVTLLPALAVWAMFARARLARRWAARGGTSGGGAPLAALRAAAHPQHGNGTAAASVVDEVARVRAGELRTSASVVASPVPLPPQLQAPGDDPPPPLPPPLR